MCLWTTTHPHELEAYAHDGVLACRVLIQELTHPRPFYVSGPRPLYAEFSPIIVSLKFHSENPCFMINVSNNKYEVPTRHNSHKIF